MSLVLIACSIQGYTFMQNKKCVCLYVVVVVVGNEDVQAVSVCHGISIYCHLWQLKHVWWCTLQQRPPLPTKKEKYYEAVSVYENENLTTSYLKAIHLNRRAKDNVLSRFTFLLILYALTVQLTARLSCTNACLVRLQAVLHLSSLGVLIPFICILLVSRLVFSTLAHWCSFHLWLPHVFFLNHTPTSVCFMVQCTVICYYLLAPICRGVSLIIKSLELVVCMGLFVYISACR